MATGIDIFLMLLVVIHSLVRLANAGTGRAIICFYELLRVIISHYCQCCLEEHKCLQRSAVKGCKKMVSVSR